MNGIRTALFGLLTGLIFGVSTAVLSDVHEVAVPDPASYWQDNGFVEMHPAIQVSVMAGSPTRTRIFLRINGHLQAMRLPNGAPTLHYPPGSAADRISYTRLRDGTYTIADVRGTRWDADGRELFHVYRPEGPEHNAPLIGYEWPRDDFGEQRQATRLLDELLRVTPAPPWGQTAGSQTRRRFRQLNNCAGCHVPDKPEAVSNYERLPPWPTDRAGLYVPLAVLADQAVLSNSRSFHDPNAADPTVTAKCADDAVKPSGRRGVHWYHCRNRAVPKGFRNVAREFAADNPYARKICQSRAYLFQHMDRNAQDIFAEAFRACGLLSVN